MAVGVKLTSAFISKFGEDRGLTITAAVTNKLFAKLSPMHSQEDLKLADSLAADILRTDTEVAYASLMSCRARLLFEAERNSEDQWFVFDTIQWMSILWALPPDEASPSTIRRLADMLSSKYLSRAHPS
ncbi:MAG TPA: hypothetical protein VEF34_18215 [Syntrophobacteraceae bacterium]|nr:hypothetical protein [Syntrophobacteraceae bacterium]